MGDRTDYHREVLHDLEGEEEGYTPEGGGYRGESEADIAAVEQPLLEQGTNAIADKDCRYRVRSIPPSYGRRLLT